MAGLSKRLKKMSNEDLKKLLPCTKDKPKVRAYIKKLMKDRLDNAGRDKIVQDEDGFDFTEDDFNQITNDEDGFEFDVSDFNTTEPMESLNLLDDDPEDDNQIIELERDNLNNNLQNRMNSEIDIKKYYKEKKKEKVSKIIPPYGMDSGNVSGNDNGMYASFDKD